MTSAEKAQSMLGIVRDVHEGATAILGANWIVLSDMAALARAAAVDDMVTYFLTYTRSAQGVRAAKQMKVYGKRSLESAQRRFMAIARSG